MADGVEFIVMGVIYYCHILSKLLKWSVVSLKWVVVVYLTMFYKGIHVVCGVKLIPLSRVKTTCISTFCR